MRKREKKDKRTKETGQRGEIRRKRGKWRREMHCGGKGEYGGKICTGGKQNKQTPYTRIMEEKQAVEVKMGGNRQDGEKRCREEGED